MNDITSNHMALGQVGASERQTIAKAFGSLDVWETEFRRIAAGLGGGSGWVVLGFNQHARQLENYWMSARPSRAMSPSAASASM